MKRLIVFILLSTLFCLSLSDAFAAPSQPSLPAGAPAFIVTLKQVSLPASGAFGLEAATLAAQNIDAVANQHHISTKARWSNGFAGFAADLTAAQVAELSADPSVAAVEPNRLFFVDAQAIPTGIRRIGANLNPYINIAGNGGNVDADVAVIDTGVGPHSDLNIFNRVTCLTGKCIAGGNDIVGHGTHVAGTIGAIDNGLGVVGVAPGARIWSIQVCASNGCLTSSIVAGINYAIANKASIEVINMSLGGYGTSTAFNTAITNAVNAGIVVVVAAGNSKADAKYYTPANSPDSFTVSALADSDGLTGAKGAKTCDGSLDDNLAYFSNFGTVVDLAAPGSCIYSTYPNNLYATMSGTSMATPHVAGAAALLASRTNPNNRTDVIAIWNKLKTYATADWKDTSGDGVREGLLSVRNTAIFNPVLK